MTRIVAAALLFASCAPVAHQAVTAASAVPATTTSSSTTTTTIVTTTLPRASRSTVAPRTRGGSPFAAARPVPPVSPTLPGAVLSSTAYCETGTMANGAATYVGAVAGNRWPLGTRLRVSDSPLGPAIYTVADRIGHGSDVDFALPGLCRAALHWGRRPVTVEVVP